MTNQEIKAECEQIYAHIKKIEERLEVLRSICKHEDTYEGHYSNRPGTVHVAKLCTYCNTPVEILGYAPTKFTQTIIKSNNE